MIVRVFALLLMFSGIVRADERLNVVSFYIDPKPPQGYSASKWDDACLVSLQEWFHPAGFKLKRLTIPANAEVRFFTQVGLKRKEGYRAVCRNSHHLRFPHIPTIGTKTTIYVDYHHKNIPYRNIMQTLRHEVAHCIGIKHAWDSVCGNIGYFELSRQDHYRLDRLRAHLIKTMTNQGLIFK